MGVGQAETSVYDMVDIFLVLLLPSGGDELQGIKKGIIEMADLIVVNKADGELKKTAEITQREYKNAAHISKKSRTNSSIGVFTCSSLNLLGNSLFSISNDSIEIENLDAKSSKVCPAATSLLRSSRILKVSFLAFSDASRLLISFLASEKVV